MLYGLYIHQMATKYDKEETLFNYKKVDNI